MLRIYFSQLGLIGVSLTLDEGCLLKLGIIIKSMRTWNSCSVVVEKTSKGLYLMEMYQPELS